jgi:hypothetical protein
MKIHANAVWKARFVLLLMLTMLTSSANGDIGMEAGRAPEVFLQKLVDGYINILNKYGGHSEELQKAPHEAIVRRGLVSFRILPGLRGDFFGSVERQWIWFGNTDGYRLRFYEADQIPEAARLEIIKHTIEAYEVQNDGLSLDLRMTTAMYKKPQFVMSHAFLKIKLNSIE